MRLPDIDLLRIRPYDGSKNIAFEELCSQIASLEPAPTNSTFFRKGRGADAGIECYRQDSDGSETGWQAKYLFTWDNNLVQQLDISIQTAIERHPQLKKYIVCLPFDLPDSRQGNKKAAKEKWDSWRKKWEEKIRQNKKRRLSIILWGRSEIIQRLTSSSALHAGRILYWFETELLTDAWFSEQFAKSKAALGTRYTPETHVSLPVRQVFLNLARGPHLQKEIDRWFLQVSDEGRSALAALGQVSNSKSRSKRLQNALDKLTKLLGVTPVQPSDVFPLEDWQNAITECLELSTKTMHWAYNLSERKIQNSRSKDSIAWVQVSTRKLSEILRQISEAIRSNQWRLTNAKAVLLVGPAGIGKSHLLADVVAHQIQQGFPAILILGSSFRDDEPWRQILEQVDRPSDEQVKSFLGALDTAAQTARTRALICIDALNERNGFDLWPHRLASFLATASAFPHIAIVLSCRSTYLSHIIPSNLSETVLPRIQHTGFAHDGGLAAKTYLDARGIVRVGVPSIVPEFENPLFLKTCCDYLAKEGKKEFPKGLRGITSIFGFYNDAITRALNHQMKLDPRLEIIPRAIRTFAQLLADTGEEYIEKTRVIEIFELIKPSQGELSKSLLSQLENEGLITIELVPLNSRPPKEFVRFTYQRFNDYVIARELLAKYLDRANPTSSFAPKTKLFQCAFGSENYKRAGIVEAIATLLPEQTGCEIFDVVATPPNSTVTNAFVSSLIWREQIHFTQHTFELAKRYLYPEDFNNMLISISTEPDNKFNAAYLHRILKAKDLPDRDASWSAHLVKQGYTGQIEALVGWILANGMEPIEEERAYLAGLMLCWLFSTSHRTVRDRATKALSCLFSTRLQVAQILLSEFESINDPYIAERLYASCYGAVLQGNNDGLVALANYVYRQVFSDGTPPADALLRDHAQGLILYAQSRGAISASRDIQRIYPPHNSPWPIEYISDELVESYIVKTPRGTFRDDIVGSTVNDGDFARYQLDHKLSKWSPCPLGTPTLLTEEEIYKEWTEEFATRQTAEQASAFDALRVAAEQAKSARHFERTPETEKRDAALATFKAALSPEQWESFRVRAKEFLLYRLFGDWRSAEPASFNIPWGRRWVCKRAHELGWTSDRFYNLERAYRSHDRNDHEIERIGKKYQWIAMRELLARMSDNITYLPNSWEPDVRYTSARQIGLRDIDPSLLATRTYYDGWKEWPKTWWVPFEPQLRPVSPAERRIWLKSESDIANSERLIDLQDPDGRRWLSLWSFAHWNSWGLSAGSKELQRDTWFRLQCIVVKAKDKRKLVANLRNKTLTDPHSISRIELHNEFYLGEYPWHPDLRNYGWTSANEGSFVTVPYRNTVASYTCERGGYDYSIDQTVSFEMPAPWLARSLQLQLRSGKSPLYVDSSDRKIFYDPSLTEPGPSAGLIDRGVFLRLLSEENLSAIWIIAGEKNAFGGNPNGRGFGGRYYHTAVYEMKSEGFKQHFHEEWFEPSEAQLAEFFKETQQLRSSTKATKEIKAPHLKQSKAKTIKKARVQ